MSRGQEGFAALLSLRSWGEPPSWHVGVFTNLEALRILYFGISMDTSLCNHDQSLIQSKTSLPFLENEGWGRKLQASNYDLVFLVTILYPDAIEELTKRTSLEQKYIPNTQEIPRDLGVLCQEPVTRIRDQIPEQKMLLALLFFKKLQGF